MKTSYKSSGVNIPEAEKFVNNLKPLVKKTFTKSVLSGIGNFGAFYDASFERYKHPVLVSSVDGVGTKIRIAALMDRYDTVGEDLVNHCTNDIAVCGAKPLYFLDYFATGKLKNDIAFELMKGIVRGCINNGCSLIGGETAEMPGLYARGDFDIAGSIVGVVDKKNIVNKENVRKGDILIGIESTGLHTNGYSLVRKIFDTPAKIRRYYKELDNTLGDELLKVHKSYLQIIQKCLTNFKINSISHITGGGIEGNTKRVIPDGTKLQVDWKSWQRPEIFSLIQREGNVPENDMRRTFNLGIGLIFIVSEKESDKLLKYLKSAKSKPHVIGKII